MELSLTRVGDTNLHMYDSGRESRLQLIFVPGVQSAESWRYQIKYFSNDYRTVSFRPTISNRDFEGHRACLRNVLSQDDVDNAVLVGSNFSNPLVQDFEVHEDVTATVLTGVRRKLKKKIPRTVYKSLSSKYFPEKLTKKLFLPTTEFREVKRFCSQVDFLDWEDFQSFQERFGVRKPEKQCLVVHGEKDFLSDQKYARNLMSSASVSVLDAGTFSFYERPEEFNKTLQDFLIKIERKAIKKDIEDTKERNKTLEEFKKRVHVSR
jgi:pimeloyl-ACP methyl ester carboxylesterase